VNIFIGAITYRFYSIILCTRPSIDEQSFPLRWMRYSKLSVWRLPIGTSWCFLRSVLIATTYISLFSQYLLTAQLRLFGQSRALLPENFSPECPRSRNTSGEESSGPMGTTSVPLVVMEVRKRFSTMLLLREDRKSILSCTANNSGYSERGRYAPIPRSLLRGSSLTVFPRQL
jgi:hypothetical protein